MSKIKVKDIPITVITINGRDYISLTDMVRSTDGEQLIKNWLRNKNTVEFLGIWERLNNEDFNLVEFDLIRLEAGTNRFLMSVNQWIIKTGAIGIQAKAGRYGGTYADKDIAFEFCTWISPEFKLLLIKEFQYLKDQEAKRTNLDWEYRRFLSKANYRIHTDAVKEKIIPKYANLTHEQERAIYASEAELLNMAIFGITAKDWRAKNPTDVLNGLNIRDVANVLQLTVLSNIETYNSILIKEGLPPKDRLEKLKAAAVSQLKSLSQVKYTFPIESPNTYQNTTFDENIKGLLNVPPPNKDK